MDKFSKILVSAAAASVLASGVMASGLNFYLTQKNALDHDVEAHEAISAAGDDYNVTGVQLTAPGDMNGVIRVDDLLKGAPALHINAYDTRGWPGAAMYNTRAAGAHGRHQRILAYYSDSELPKDATLTFKVNCGMLQKIGAQDVFLYALDSNGSANTNAWIRVGHLTDFEKKVENGLTGYTKLKFAVNSNYEVANDTAAGVTNGGGVDHNFTMYNGAKETVDDQQGNIPAGTLLVFATERNSTQITQLSDRGTDYNNDTNLTSLSIVPRKGDACGCVCDTSIELTEAKDKTGSDLTAPMSGVKSVPLITYAAGLRAVITHWGADDPHWADSWIDLRPAAGRKRFVDEGAGSDTRLLNSSFRIHLDEYSAQYGVDLTGTQDLFKLNINRAIDCAVKRVDITDTQGHTKEVVKNATTGAYELEESFANMNVRDVNITFTVSGTDVICPGMWRASLEIVPGTPGVASKKVLDVANADDWRMQAMEFIVPYLNTDPNYGTYIVITNQGDQTASVTFDAFGDSGKNEGQASSAYYTNVPLGDIPRRSTRIYFPNQMNDALHARFPAFNANRYMAHFYVATSNPNPGLVENLIEAAAFQKDGNNGKRSIPVLTQGRVWNGVRITGHTFHE